MFKLLSFLTLFLGLQAHANDSGMVLVDVLGIAPASGVTKTEVKVYGKDTKRLAQVLPVTDVEGGRSVTMASDAWVTEIYCQKKYERPTNGEKRSDWMCTFMILPRSESAVDMGDIEKTIAEPGMFNAFVGSGNRKALGIVPGPNSGEVFSVYGQQLGVLAAKLPQTLAFTSASYRVEFSCQKSYSRPTNGEARHDYMCSLFVGSPAGMIVP